MRKLLAIAALTVLATSGCKKDNKSGSQTQTDPKADPLAKDKPVDQTAKQGDGTKPADSLKPDDKVVTPEAPGPQNGPTVTLVSAGSDPKVQLRYKPQQGDKASVDMVMTMGMELNMGGGGGGGGGGMPRMEMPPITMTMDTEITSSTADAFELAAEVTKVDVDAKKSPDMAGALGPIMQKMVGMKMTSRMTRRGIMEKVDVKLPADFDPQMAQMMDQFKQSMNQMTAPFPEEAVGVGAKWKVASNIDINGAHVTQTVSFELVSLDGDKGTAKVSLEQNAAAQTMTMGGVSAKLEHMTGGGSGTMTFDLVRVMPQDAKLAMKTELAINAQGQSAETKMDIDMTINSKKK
jgi:hypothetical protein